MDIAAPRAERRAGAGAVLVLLAFLLLAPPVFMLGPLAALLAVSRPGSWRERIWLAATVLLTTVWLAAPGDLAQQVIRAGAMGLTGGTLAVALSGRRVPPFRQAVTATLAATLGTLTWGAVLGTSFGAFRTAIANDLRAGYQALGTGGTGTAPSPEVQRFITGLVESADTIAGLYPGALMVLAVAGTMLAWLWLHRIAGAPVGPAPDRFRHFRFNDHVVWGAIFTLAAWLAPVPEGLRLVAANLLVAWVALYVARGAAVAVTFLAGSPLPMRIVALAFAVPFFPFACGALLAMGLADTWIDFRRRPPPATGGVEG